MNLVIKKVLALCLRPRVHCHTPYRTVEHFNLEIAYWQNALADAKQTSGGRAEDARKRAA